MMKAALAAAFLPAFVQAGERYAVIAAGSAGFYNYRHQADACHAYHVMLDSGIKAENIILMMQDDVANSPDNPFKGKLYNQPGNASKDVYEGCKIDYRGKVVTGQLFTDVITGNKAGAGGRVLESSSGDTVFINFVDHGGVGIIAFPNGPVYHASELSKALKLMKSKNMYKELVFYMEACESGSMFPDVTADDKILAVTAANAHESSWGFYCGNDAKVHGKNIGSCLGDLFSISWLEDSDFGKFSSETFDTQITRVTKRTNKSHVLQFGDMSIKTQTIGDVMDRVQGEPTPADFPQSNAVDVRDLDLAQAVYAYEHAETDEEKKRALRRVQEIAAARKADEDVFNGIVKAACHDVNMHECKETMIGSTTDLKDMDCHYKLVQTVFDQCPRREEHGAGGWNGYNMKFSQVLANLCESQEKLGKDADTLDKIIRGQCGRASGETAQIIV